MCMCVCVYARHCRVFLDCVKACCFVCRRTLEHAQARAHVQARQAVEEVQGPDADAGPGRARRRRSARPGRGDHPERCDRTRCVIRGPGRSGVLTAFDAFCCRQPRSGEEETTETSVTRGTKALSARAAARHGRLERDRVGQASWWNRQQHFVRIGCPAPVHLMCSLLVGVPDQVEPSSKL